MLFSGAGKPGVFPWPANLTLPGRRAASWRHSPRPPERDEKETKERGLGGKPTSCPPSLAGHKRSRRRRLVDQQPEHPDLPNGLGKFAELPRRLDLSTPPSIHS